MSVIMPPLAWPEALDECGPPEDRAILLKGAAEIASARFQVVAIRVSPHTLTPDLRAELEDEGVYAGYPLWVMLDELEFLGDIEPANLVTLSTGRYVVCVLPLGDAMPMGIAG